MKPSELLAAAKKGLGVSTDGELGRAIGWDSGKVSQYKTDKKWPGNEAILLLSKAAGLNPLDTIGELEMEKAKDEQTKTDWGKALASIRKVVCVLVLAVLASLAAHSLTALDGFAVFYRRLRLTIIFIM